MRILYGKFHSHESTHTSKKDTKSNKRGIIIQFLSSCNENELYYFFDLLFGCIYKVIKDETNQIESINLDDSEKINTFITNLQIKLSNYYGENTYYTLNNIIPLKKLLGVLDSLEIIIKKLARRMEHFSHRLLQILCFIHKYSLTLYEMGNSNIIDEKQTNNKSSGKLISDHHMNLLRIIRQKVTLRFKQVNLFFKFQFFYLILKLTYCFSFLKILII